MRRQFFSFFMPLLHLQLYRGLCLSASMALRHSSLASRPATILKLLSFPPATHCRIVRYLELHACSFRHCSLALTQSSRLAPARRLSSAKDNTSGSRNGTRKTHARKAAECHFVRRLTLCIIIFLHFERCFQGLPILQMCSPPMKSTSMT